ncbi:MAG: sigma-54 interaction domain-containing protein [Acidobacteriota bacterium]
MTRTSEPATTGTARRRSQPVILDFLPPRDPAMQAVVNNARRVASSRETVLLLGETGVGKDVLARWIHESSPRAGAPFCHVNCAALVDGLVESELFGHVRGAFTGAIDSRPGRFERAAGGTLYLDEIAELTSHQQAKLLHVLQNRRFRRVGGQASIEADVRVIAATNRDLDVAMSDGRLRRDLYYRLSVVSLRIPPLRERPQDLESLTRHFARKYAAAYGRPELATPPDDVIACLGFHRFEGNIRELENLVKRAMLLGGYEEILQVVDPLPCGASPVGRAEDDGPEAPLFVIQKDTRPLKQVAREATARAERQAIIAALAATRWNRCQAARRLAISYRSLLYKIQDYAIRPPRDEASGVLGAGPGIFGFKEGSA